MFFPLFDGVLNVATPILHLEYVPGRQLGIGHNEPDPWKEFPHLPFDLGNHSALSALILYLIPKDNQLDLNPTLERSPNGAVQVGVDQPVKNRIGRGPDEVSYPFTLAVFINLELDKSRILANLE